MSCGFTVTDPLGVVVTFDHAAWARHVQRGQHLEVAPVLPLFANVIALPTYIVANPAGQRYYLRHGLGTGALAGHWLQLIVRDGALRTWRFTRTAGIRDGRQLWPPPRF